jgi:glyoxalase family protein
MTFFDWAQAAPRRVGPGSVTETAMRVSGSETLAWWEQRLGEMQVPHGSIEERAGRLSLPFTDFEGQQLRLVDDGGAPGGVPWDRASVPSDKGIRGLDAVTLCVRHADPTVRVLTQVLGLRATREYTDVEQRPVIVYEMGAGGPGYGSAFSHVRWPQWNDGPGRRPPRRIPNPQSRRAARMA